MSRSWESIARTKYDPLKAGSIDGTDERPHDNAVCRAIHSFHKPPQHIRSDPRCTMFVARLPLDITEKNLRDKFDEFASVRNVTVVRDIVTGVGKGYAFVEFRRERDLDKVIYECQSITFDGKPALLDYEVGRTLKGWIPRRLGGGWGGRKEAGQLRFGCRDRPWKDPIGRESYQFRTYDRKEAHGQKSYERRETNRRR